MTVTALEILGSGGEKHPILPLDVEWDTGLALYCERRWPVGRRKAVEKEWGLSVDDARAVVEGKASKRIISRIWKHPRGGWAVALPVMGAVIGQPINEFFRQQARAAAEEEKRALEHDRLARTAYRRLLAGASGPGDDGPGSEAARKAGRGAGAMGSEAPRRLAG